MFALTCKGAVFNWDQSCQQSFNKLKLCLTAAPVLAYPDFSIYFKLESDASRVGLGAVLSQTQKNGNTKPLHAVPFSLGITIMESLSWRPSLSCGLLLKTCLPLILFMNHLCNVLLLTVILIYS